MIKKLLISEVEKERILKLHFKNSKRNLILEQYFKLANGKPYYHKNMVERLPDFAIDAEPISKEEYDKLLGTPEQQFLNPILKNNPAYFPDPNQKQKDPNFDYIKFGELGEIPVKKGTKPIYLSSPNPDVGNLLGITTKDRFGYYEEVYIEMYEQKVKRYFPKNFWDDWEFLYNKGIPIGFETPNEGTYHLSLVLVDPIKSVIDIREPGVSDDDNMSRGWVLSSPSFTTTRLGDSKTGYFKTENGNEIPYNITAPLIRNDFSTWNLDTRGQVVKFLDSTWGIIIQIGLSIAITLLLRRPIAINLPAWLVGSQILTMESLAARQVIATMITEALVNVPIAVIYFKEGGQYNKMGWISLFFCFIPYLQFKVSFLRNLLEEYSQSALTNLAKKVVEKNLEKMSVTELEVWLSKLTLEEKTLFVKIMSEKKAFEGLKESIEKYTKDFIEQYDEKWINNPQYKAAWFNLEKNLMKKISFKQSILTDFTTTYYFAKAFGEILDRWYKIEKKTEDPQNKEEKVKENLKKLDDKIKGLPQFIKNYYKKNEDKELNVVFAQLSNNDVLWMVDNGVFSERAVNLIMEPFINYDNCDSFYKSLPEIWSIKLAGYVNYAATNFKSYKEQMEELKNKNEIWFNKLTEENKKKYIMVLKCLDENQEQSNKKIITCSYWSISADTNTTKVEYVDCSDTTKSIDNLSSSPLKICVKSGTTPSFSFTGTSSWYEVSESEFIKFVTDQTYETKTENVLKDNLDKIKYMVRKKNNIAINTYEVCTSEQNSTQNNQNQVVNKKN